MQAFLSLVALIILCVVIWFGGEYFELSIATRIIAIVVVLCVWLLIYLIQRLLAIRASAMIERRLRAQAEEQIASSRPVEREEIGELERRLNEALQALKTSKGGKSALAQLPWYIIIGPPGSGKSTALQKSGLDFPQVNQALNGIRGVGGTRNCEWWFTNDGILLDTAGRYTTEEEDRDEWLGFLSLIKDARSRTPINGALVAISVPEVLNASDAELERHAKAVRARLDELCQQLEEVFPVYLMFTKCDLLEGFVDFFEDLDKEQRAQVWGFSLPYESLTADRYEEAFERECSALFERLCQHRVAALAIDRPDAKRQRIYSFPLQFALARERLGRFIGAVFRANPFGESAILRGFYFTSGTQEGRPIDQVVAAMRDAFGAAAQKQEAAAGEGEGEAGEGDAAATATATAVAEPKVEKKSYFINQLFKRIIFADAELARSSAAAQRRRRIVRYASFAGCAVGVVVFTTLFLVSFFNNRALTQRVAAGVAAVAAAPAENRTARLAALDELRVAVAELDDYEDDLVAPLSLSFGLYQGGDLDEEARPLYFGVLRDVLLEPCVEGLEEELRDFVKTEGASAALKERYGLEHDQALYDQLYRILSTYLALTGGSGSAPDPIELEEMLRARDRWLRGLQPEAGGDAPPKSAQEAAWRQFEFLAEELDRPEDWALPADDKLVHDVRQKLDSHHWISQSYASIRDGRMSEVDDYDLDELFKRPGRAVLTGGTKVSLFFTRKDWDDKVELYIEERSEGLSEQYADLGIEKPADEIADDLREIYEKRGQRAWVELIDATRIARPEDARDAVKQLKVLADGEQTPLPTLFRDVWPRQYVLDVEERRAAILAAEEKAAAEAATTEEEAPELWHTLAANAFGRLHEALNDFVTKTEPGERFWPLAQEADLATFDPVRDALQDVRADLLDLVLERVPEGQRPLARRLFEQALDQVREVLAAEAAAEANAWWEERIYEPISVEFARRYPFAAAQDEVSLEDMNAMFRPEEGTLWRTRKALRRLASYKVQGRPLLRIASPAEESLTEAERLRDALFAKAAEEVAVEFKVKLIKREGIRNIRFKLGDQSFTHDELPPGKRPDVTWDGAEGGAALSALTVDQESWVHEDFPNTEWGLSRLLDAGVLDTSASEGRQVRYTWTFDVAGTERLVDVELEGDRDATTPLLRRRLFGTWKLPPSEVAP